MSYQVQTPVFEGPFDLLLHLILQQEVELYDIDLSPIVDTYLQHIATMEQLDLEIATEFLLIAATLVELKAQRLLPKKREINLDDELGIWEERDLLLARLVECKVFKNAAVQLLKLDAVAAKSLPRALGPTEEHFIGLAPDLLHNTSLTDLRDAYLRAISPVPDSRVDLSHISPIKITVAKVVEQLVTQLPDLGGLTFRDLTASLVDRIEVVVYFLALLELFKDGFVSLEQPETFGDIAIRWQGLVADKALADVDEYAG